MNDSVKEPLFRAQDAYSSAVLLSLLVLAGQIIALVTIGKPPHAIPFPFHVALAVIASLALAYLVATRQRPQERAAWAAARSF